jgi:hypothetical protein
MRPHLRGRALAKSSLLDGAVLVPRREVPGLQKVGTSERPTKMPALYSRLVPTERSQCEHHSLVEERHIAVRTRYPSAGFHHTHLADLVERL